MAFDLASVGLEGSPAAAAGLSTQADEYVNDASLERLWAIKAHRHAETYFKLISSVDSSRLRLTNFDDDIYRQFKRFFKNMKLDVIDPMHFKSEESKVIWRPFCNMYKGRVDDYNFATLLRLDCSKGYDDENTILTTRIQFYAVEIARNRRGLNKRHSEKTSTEDVIVQETR